MVMRREGEVQGDLVVTWAEMPRSPGHAFYDRLQKLLNEAGFDGFVEAICKPFYAPRMGAPSLPPGRYFRMHMVGYFEGIDSERGIVWRCSDSFSLRDFLRLAHRDKVPDHSWLSKTRSRLPHEVHEQVFGWVLNLVASGSASRSSTRPPGHPIWPDHGSRRCSALRMNSNSSPFAPWRSTAETAALRPGGTKAAGRG